MKRTPGQYLGEVVHLVSRLVPNVLRLIPTKDISLLIFPKHLSYLFAFTCIQVLNVFSKQLT